MLWQLYASQCNNQAGSEGGGNRSAEAFTRQVNYHTEIIRENYFISKFISVCLECSVVMHYVGLTMSDYKFLILLFISFNTRVVFQNLKEFYQTLIHRYDSAFLVTLSPELGWSVECWHIRHICIECLVSEPGPGECLG